MYNYGLLRSTGTTDKNDPPDRPDLADKEFKSWEMTTREAVYVALARSQTSPSDRAGAMARHHGARECAFSISRTLKKPSEKSLCECSILCSALLLRYFNTLCSLASQNGRICQFSEISTCLALNLMRTHDAASEAHNFSASHLMRPL